MAISTGEMVMLLKSPERIVPIRVSNAAEDERPAPFNTSLVMQALNPPILKP